MSKAMQLLIEDLEKCKTKENEAHVNEMIRNAKLNVYDDFLSKISFPMLTLVENTTRCSGLEQIRENVKQGKYDAQL